MRQFWRIYASNDRSSQWWDYYRSFDNFVNWDYAVLIELRNPNTVNLFIQEFGRILSVAVPIINTFAKIGQLARASVGS